MGEHKGKQRKHPEKVNEPLSGSKKVKNKNHSRQKQHSSHDM